MSEMRIRSERSERIELVAHNPVGGIIAPPLSAGIYLVARSGVGLPAAVARWMALFFVILAIVALVHRDALTLDLIRGRWERTRGLWPFLKHTTGSLEEIREVEVVEELGHRRGRPENEWELWLRSSNPAVEARLWESKDEVEAQRKRHHYEQLLGLDGS